MNFELSCDSKQCSTSTGQCSEVSDNSQEIPERCSLKESKSDYMCNLCNKSFAKASYLNNHIKLHVPNKPHSCQICFKSFKLKGDLKKHSLTHSEEKHNVCNICNKSFTHKRNLKDHLLIHSGERPHLCNICTKSFTQKVHLNKHLLTHSGVKPHSCNICNKSFTLKLTLKDHLLTHSGEKPHVCDICSMAFGRENNLYRHLLIHSRKKDMQNSSSDKGEELASTSENSKNVILDSHMAETSENSHENNHPRKLQITEEIVYIVEERNVICDEDNKDLFDGDMPIKYEVDLHEMSCDFKEKEIYFEVNDIKEEPNIDYEGNVSMKCDNFKDPVK